MRAHRCPPTKNRRPGPCVAAPPPEATCRISSNSASSCLCRPEVSTMMRSLRRGRGAVRVGEWERGRGGGPRGRYGRGHTKSARNACCSAQRALSRGPLTCLDRIWPALCRQTSRGSFGSKVDEIRAGSTWDASPIVCPLDVPLSALFKRAWPGDARERPQHRQRLHKQEQQTVRPPSSPTLLLEAVHALLRNDSRVGLGVGAVKGDL